MIDQGKNVFSPTAPGPGRLADADIPASQVPNDSAYGAMTAGGFGLVGHDASGARALPNGVAMDYNQQAASGGGGTTPVTPTGVTAGTPGSLTPSGATVPATLADLNGLGIGTGAAWATGQYITIGSGDVHWDGATFKTGKAP